MKAFIFAAGLGTRLKPLTDTMPKALVPVGGKPLLDRVIGKMKDSGISEFVINTHHFAKLIEEHLKDADNYGCHIDISLEKDYPLETGGGIKAARKYLEGCGFFLAHNVDILTDINLKTFADEAKRDCLATLIVSSRESSRYLLFDEGMRLVGWTNVKTGEVKSPYRNLDPSNCQRNAFSGIHLISDKVFPLMENEPEVFSIIDFYLNVAAEHPIYGVEIPNAKILDVGKPDAFHKAEEMGLL